MVKAVKRIAVLTGGGDCPGLNAAIRAVVRAAWKEHIEVYGVERGFQGFENNNIRKIHREDIYNIISHGGTFLKSSRFNPFQNAGAVPTLKKRMREHKLDGLVVIGGDGSLGIAKDLWDKYKFPVLGIPKTIDNDVYGTEFTIGFHTAVQTAVENMDRLITTAESHNMIMIVEVMGRHCGLLAAHAGLAAGAEYVLIPEIKSKIGDLVSQIEYRHKHGRNSSLIVVAEDAQIYDEKGQILAQTGTVVDQYGKLKLGGIAWSLKEILEDRLDFEIRCAVLGHVQRGGTPIAFDRYLATLMGNEAVNLVIKNNWGKLIAYEKSRIVNKPLGIVRKGVKRVPKSLFDVAQTYFG